MLFGADISHYQGDAVGMADMVDEGFSFVIIKATEGSGYTDPKFAENHRDAVAAGLVTAAYHYQRPGSISAQVDRIKAVVPRDCPVCLDVERGSGDAALTRTLVDALRAEGYSVPLLYLPQWYWREIGSPDLSGLPPLWSSRWPDTNGGYASEIYQRVPESYWNGYGGLSVAVLQFTAHATISDHSPVDADAYRGTRAQLRALFNEQEDDMDPWELLNTEMPLWVHPGEPERDTMPFWQQCQQARSYGFMSFHRAVAIEKAVNQLPALIKASGKADPKAVAEELRPVLGDVVGPVVDDAVRDALGADNEKQAEEVSNRILAKLAERLAVTENSPSA